MGLVMWYSFDLSVACKTLYNIKLNITKFHYNYVELFSYNIELQIT